MLYIIGDHTNMKRIKVNKEKYGWLKDLYDKGYQYVVIPKKNKKEFYATKANQKKNGTFRDTAKFDTMKLTGTDEWIPGSDAKGVFIKLDKAISCKKIVKGDSNEITRIY